MFEKFSLKGRLALVTGGGTGLGYHMSRALAQAGAKVLISARRADVLEAATAKLNAEPGVSNVSWHVVDLNNRDSIKALAAHAAGLGGVDIFIGNAGQDFNEHILDIKNSSIDQIMQVNVSANVELVRAFVPHMRAQKWGRILFSSSASTRKISSCRTSIDPSPIQMEIILSIYWTDCQKRFRLGP